MPHHRHWPFSALASLAAIAALTTGCGGGTRWNWFQDNSKPEPSGQVIVEHYDDVASMTPAQQDRLYREVYAQGIKFAGTGQYGVALGSFEQALRLRPDSVEAQFNLAACHDAIGDPMKAISMYRSLIQVTPDDPDCYANLGTSFIKMYHREKSPAWRRLALEAWQQSLQLEPNQPVIREYLARSQEE